MTTTGQNVDVITKGAGRKADVLGVILEWKLAAAETDGAYCVLEATVPPGVGVPMHQHAEQEAFYVIEGEASFARMGEKGVEWIAATPGDVVRIPGDVMHGFRNAGSAPVRLLITAEGKLAEFFEEAGAPVKPGVAGPPAMEEIQRVMAIAEKHGQRFAPPSA